MKYKCVISDLDWTLLTGDSELDNKTKKALTTLIDNNILFIPATGRAFNSVPQCIVSLPGVKHIITSNGVAIYDALEGKPIMNSHLSTDTVSKILIEGRKNNLVLETFVNGQPFTSIDYYNNPTAYGAKLESVNYIQRTRTAVEDIYSFIESHKNELDCIDVISTPDKKTELMNTLIHLLPDNYITTSAPQLIEISDGNSGKHQRMQDLLNLYNIDLSEVVAFGDGDNDSDMLALAGLGVAMGNATKKCQQSADFVTDTNENLGVYKALCKIFPELLS